MAKKKSKKGTNPPQKPSAKNPSAKNPSTKNTPAQKPPGAAKPASSATKPQATRGQRVGGEHKAQTKNQKRRAKKQAQKLASNMAASGNREEEANTAMLLPYGPTLSRARLDAFGFHPAVTRLSPKETIISFSKMVVKSNNRPSRDEYVSTKFTQGFRGFNQGNYTSSKRLVDAVYIVNPIPDPAHVHHLDFFVAGALPWNREMAVELAGNGFRLLQDLATASPRAWVNLASEMAIYDCNVNKFRGTASGKVFLAVTPEYTVEDFKANVDAYADGSNRSSEVAWVCDALNREKKDLEEIQDIYDGTGSTPPYWAEKIQFTNPAGWGLHPRLNTRIRALRSVDNIILRRQVLSTPGHHPYRLSCYQNVLHLQDLLKAINGRREITEVLHFQKIPMLDRRLLAVILRGCPNVRMLGVYDCPLIHFGDVITLLDLIHEINQDRRQKDRPLIEAFDFYPRYNYGTPYKARGSATYGITWGPRNKEVVQRGQFRVILEAYLKSSKMGIKLLFEEGHAFRDYLSRVPGHPLAVPSFLDGLHRYLDLVKARSTDSNALRQAMYDTLKPVRMDLETLDRDWTSDYYRRTMRYLVFCCSCGYEMSQAFFTTGARGSRPHQRVCAGCILRKYLDTEPDHGKESKLLALDGLFPNWEGREFNPDAPLDRHGQNLLRLESTDSNRPPAPIPVVLPDGSIHTPRYTEPYLRDGKIHLDSVQGLPDLATLTNLRLSLAGWLQAPMVGHFFDMERITNALLCGDYPVAEGGLKPFASVCVDGGMTDHFDELQPMYNRNAGAKFPCGPSDNLEQAWNNFVRLRNKGF